MKRNRLQHRQVSLFEGQRLQMDESIALSIASLEAYALDFDHWVIAWSGGKDSTAKLTFVVWLLATGRIRAPKRLTVLYADTRLELLPLFLSAQTIREELDEHKRCLAARGCVLDVRTVMAPLDKRFLVYILGRGVPPPNNSTLRWCTRQIKVDPMRAEIARVLAEHGPAITLTGVRLGESAARDARIALSCSKGDGECGQGWYQRDLADRGQATLAPLLHWRVCHVWRWLKEWAPKGVPGEDFGGWTTELLAEVYGGEEAEELHARTGCVGCPLATQDTALDALLKRSAWAYLAPLKDLRPLWRELRTPLVRLRKPGGETRADGTLVENQHRMGPITLEARLHALDTVLSIQQRVNDEADAQKRPRVDLLNDEEAARIRELIAARTWPQRWSGDEPLASEPFDDPRAQVAPSEEPDDLQALLFDMEES